MKGELLYKILDFLEDRAIGAFDFFDTFSGPYYRASAGQFRKQYEKRTEARFEYQIKREQKRKLQKYISKLKRDGLISENTDGKLTVSRMGKDKLNILRSKNFIDKEKYYKESSGKVIIISYDIPIEFNRARNILRSLLKRLGFNMVHKSVWVGKVKLPKGFIKDLHILNILDDVEILEVTKSGTLKTIN